jgi:hypothetical protein
VLLSRDNGRSCDAKKGKTEQNRETTKQTTKTQEEKHNAKNIISLLISLTTLTKVVFFYILEYKKASAVLNI